MSIGVDCVDWRANTEGRGGICARGLFGGNPSIGSCTKCQCRVPRQQDFEETPEQVRVELMRGGCGCSRPSLIAL